MAFEQANQLQLDPSSVLMSWDKMDNYYLEDSSFFDQIDNEIGRDLGYGDDFGASRVQPDHMLASFVCTDSKRFSVECALQFQEHVDLDCTYPSDSHSLESATDLLQDQAECAMPVWDLGCCDVEQMKATSDLLRALNETVPPNLTPNSAQRLKSEPLSESSTVGSCWPDGTQSMKQESLSETESLSVDLLGVVPDVELNLCPSHKESCATVPQLHTGSLPSPLNAAMLPRMETPLQGVLPLLSSIQACLPFHPVMAKRVTQARREGLERYRAKKARRFFAKKIRYQLRKINADKRPRIKGRFVKKDPTDEASAPLVTADANLSPNSFDDSDTEMVAQTGRRWIL